MDERRLLEHGDYSVVIDGLNIKIKEGVFAPDEALTYSSALIINNLPKVIGKSVLDMGTGTGVIAAVCANRGASEVVAVDINSSAISNAKENVPSHVRLVVSDLFEDVNGIFDFIFANLPISDTLWEAKESTLKVIDRFLKDSRGHLKQDGEIYLTWFSLREVEPIIDLIKKYDYSFETITEEKFNFTWYLFIIKK